MGLADVVYDNIHNLLDDLTEYEYFVDFKDEIIMFITEQLRFVNKLDGFPIEISNEKYELNLKNNAKSIYRNYILDKYDV